MKEDGEWNKSGTRVEEEYIKRRINEKPKLGILRIKMGTKSEFKVKGICSCFVDLKFVYATKLKKDFKKRKGSNLAIAPLTINQL